MQSIAKKTCAPQNADATSHLETKFEDHQFVLNAAVHHEHHMETPKTMARVISLVKEGK